MSRFGRVLWGITTVAILGVLVLGVLNIQAVADWFSLRNYQPPAEIKAIADADAMTNSARRIFYATHPVLVNNTATFRQNCPTFEQTIVLGCYHSGLNSSIYIYDISDPRLDGVVEVTAAHEMLHAGYDRLSQKEKTRIDGLLNDYYTNKLSDKRVIETIESYKKAEPTELLNEMHSIFGTELASLTPELEAYYQEYFTNRGAVVGFAEKYGDEFTSRLETTKQYEQQLTDLKQKIGAEEAALADRLQQIEADRRRLDSLRESGQVAAYNAAVDDFNAKVAAYNAAVNQLKADIAEYNRVVAAHNELAAELRGLYDALNTSLTPQTAQ